MPKKRFYVNVLIAITIKQFGGAREITFKDINV